MSFKVTDKKLFKNYVEIWEKSQQFDGYKIG